MAMYQRSNGEWKDIDEMAYSHIKSAALKIERDGESVERAQELSDLKEIGRRKGEAWMAEHPGDEPIDLEWTH